MRSRGQIEVESVRLVPRRMIRRGVQGIEVVVLGLDLRTVGQREAQSVKNVHDPV